MAKPAARKSVEEESKRAAVLLRATDFARAVGNRIEPFNGGAGFEDWQYDALNFLDGHGVREAVESDITKGEDGTTKLTGEELERVKVMDKYARGLLHSITGATIRVKVRMASTAYEAWNMISGDYEQVNETNVFRLTQELLRMQFTETEKLEVHLSKMMKIVEKIRTSGGEIKDEMIKMAMLSSLPPSYREVRKAFQTRLKEVNLNELQEQLLIEELEQQREAGTSGSGEDDRRALAFHAARGQVKNVKCYNCGQLGHVAKVCGNERVETRTCYVCGQKGHVSPSCPEGQKATQKAAGGKKQTIL